MKQHRSERAVVAVLCAFLSQEKYPEQVRDRFRARADQRGAVGYFGPFPAWRRDAE